MMTSICEQCGHEISVSDWPFCPHGPSRLATIGDDIPGGKWFENGWSVPRKFYSHSEHRRALDAAGLEIRAKNAGPNDKHCPRWDTVDLEAAAALVRRGEEARAAKDTRWADAQADITVTVLDETVKARDLAD